MSKHINRRRFLRGTVMTGGVAAGFVGLEEQILKDALAAGADTAGRKRLDLPGPMPYGQIGDVKMSRIISGGNLIAGYAHSRDLLYVSQLMREYNTEERQFDTFEMLEEGGVNTVLVNMTTIEKVRKYNRERGGNLQILTQLRPLWAKMNRPAHDDIKEAVDRIVDQGVELMYLHGGYSDQLVKSAVQYGRTENLDYIGDVLEYVRSKGMPAGLGSHALEVPIACEEAGVEPDFYVKTFHHDRYWSAHPKENREPFSVDARREEDHNKIHDNIFDLDPEATAAYMKKKEQPFIAFKVFAAGAIPPDEGLQFAFQNGADFAAIGMFDFQIEEDLRVAIETIANLEGRERPWRA